MNPLATLVLISLAVSSSSAADSAPTRREVLDALRRAVEFYRGKVSTEGGYHSSYAADLSYGRSEHGEGPTQVEVQRETTPGVAMAVLEAYDATGDRYYLEAARDAARALVRGQLCSGGWDYLIEFDPARRARHHYRADGHCAGPAPAGAPPSTLDDNITQAAARLLMRVDRELNRQDPAIHEAARFALESLLKAQYPNGAWPQRFHQPPDRDRFPVRRASYPDDWPRKWPGSNYQTHYTFNDNTLSDAIDMFLEAGRIYGEPRYRAAAEQGGEFILLAQMPDPQPAWAQQYDNDMRPAWARVFEPPSVTGGESQGVLRTLLVLYRETGNRRFLEPVPRALAYLKNSALPPAANPSEARRRVGAGVVLARFYEMKTNRPLYITKGTRVDVRGGPSSRLDGYELSYTDESVITHYAVLVSGDDLENIARDYERIAQADPVTLRRPEKLRGLSPWSAREAAPERAADLAPRVRRILSAMDPRGAWVEEGTIGKADRVVSLFAARDMVATLGGRAYPVKENQTLEVFQGPQPPRERILRSRAFIRNVGLLSEYLTALGR